MKNKKMLTILFLGFCFFFIVGCVSFVFVDKLFSYQEENTEDEQKDKEEKETSSSIENIFHGKETKEEKIKKELEKIGKDFYENFYYDSFLESNSTVAKYQDIGIKFDLDNISRLLSIKGKKADNIQELIEGTNGILCSSKETMVIFYPKEPFGKSDYTILVELSCTIE